MIRETETREIVYVGSSAGTLYDTLTRHFQTWRRYKGFWRGQYAEGHDPGLTYDRARVDQFRELRFTARRHLKRSSARSGNSIRDRRTRGHDRDPRRP